MQMKSYKAKMKMNSVIWNHGRKKANLTEAISKLKRTDLADHPDIKIAIDLLTRERQRLQNKELF